MAPLRLRQARRAARIAWILAAMAARASSGRARPRTIFERARWLQAVARRLATALGVQVRETGAPAEGSLIVSNHLGYLDIVVLASRAPTVFVAKREVARWPVFGWFARRAGTRFVDRTRRSDVARVVTEMTEALAAGVNVVLFPEGTSTDGRTVKPFRSSLLEPAARNALPATPAAIAYRVPEGHQVEREVCWWGEMKLLPHLWNLCSLAPIEARIRWGHPLTSRRDRKDLARALHAEVAALHVQLGSASNVEGDCPATEHRQPSPKNTTPQI